MRGIQSAAAGPTGCIMYSMSAFDLFRCDPRRKAKCWTTCWLDKIDKARRYAACEWSRGSSMSQQTSGERLRRRQRDVTNTREIGFAGLQKHKEPVVFCNWDAWLAHFKPKCVVLRFSLKLESVSNLFKEVVLTGISEQEQIRGNRLHRRRPAATQSCRGSTTGEATTT